MHIHLLPPCHRTRQFLPHCVHPEPMVDAMILLSTWLNSRYTCTTLLQTSRGWMAWGSWGVNTCPRRRHRGGFCRNRYRQGCLALCRMIPCSRWSTAVVALHTGRRWPGEIRNENCCLSCSSGRITNRSGYGIEY